MINEWLLPGMLFYQYDCGLPTSLLRWTMTSLVQTLLSQNQSIVCVHTYMHTSAHIDVHRYTYTYCILNPTHLHTGSRACTHTRVHKHVYTRTHVFCACVCVYSCAYTRMRICVYIYLHTYILSTHCLERQTMASLYLQCCTGSNCIVSFPKQARKFYWWLSGYPDYH